MPALMFLAKYWKYFAAAGCILAVYLYWHSLTSTIARQDAAIIQYKVNEQVQQANLDSCTNANAAFQDLIKAMNETNLKLNDLNSKMNASLTDLMKTVKKQAEDIKRKEKQLAEVPWDQLNCPDQVNACYEIIRSQP